MERINKQKLIHPPECFQRSELERRQTAHKFVHLAKVEAFAWDLELYAQLQKYFEERVVLKGGAAAQLYFPVPLQRNSVDVDVITDLPVEELEAGLNAIANEICPTGEICNFTAYVPKRPTDGLRVTKYEVQIPSICPPEMTRNPGAQTLTLDVLYGKIPSAHLLDHGLQTFALDLAFAPRLITADALFGDKLLTLASTTVGIPDERANDRCKQLYDLHRLVDLQLLRDSTEIQDSFKHCMDIQHQLSGQRDFSLEDAVIDVERFLQRARLLDFDDPLKLWMSLRSFQSNFVGVDARILRDEWAVGIERLRLLVEGLLAQQQDSNVEPLAVLKGAQALEQIAQRGFEESDDPEARSKHVQEVKERFRNFCEIKKIRTRTVQGLSPLRAFWCLVTFENIQEIEDLLKDL
jgi:hypothetical protein